MKHRTEAGRRSHGDGTVGALRGNGASHGGNGSPGSYGSHRSNGSAPESARGGNGFGGGGETPQTVLVTGGAGFVGSNLADRLAREGRRVRLLDDLSRPGVEANLAWLESEHPEAVEVLVGDVAEPERVVSAVRGVDRVFHLASQVAVTTGLEDPRHDFRVNLEGTLNVLEALRAEGRHRLAEGDGREPPGIVFTSTNKVYGNLEDVELTERGGRWEPADAGLAGRGVGEERRLDFRSPYGCSKGGADQYVVDYARTMGVPGVVLRMSCVYGPHQHGTEDQGWVAHFLLRALAGEPVTLYGDGRQVRDLLFVDDLVEALLAADRLLPELSGRAFNLGGGPERAVSLLEVLERIGEATGRPPEVDFAPWRPGDQRWYVSDTSRFREATGWRPRVGVEEGIRRLHEWMVEAKAKEPLAAPPPLPVARRGFEEAVS